MSFLDFYMSYTPLWESSIYDDIGDAANSRELWQMAKDMRAHPSDYADKFNFVDMLWGNTNSYTVYPSDDGKSVIYKQIYKDSKTYIPSSYDQPDKNIVAKLSKKNIEKAVHVIVDLYNDRLMTIWTKQIQIAKNKIKQLRKDWVDDLPQLRKEATSEEEYLAQKKALQKIYRKSYITQEKALNIATQLKDKWTKDYYPKLKSNTFDDIWALSSKGTILMNNTNKIPGYPQGFNSISMDMNNMYDDWNRIIFQPELFFDDTDYSNTESYGDFDASKGASYEFTKYLKANFRDITKTPAIKLPLPREPLTDKEWYKIFKENNITTSYIYEILIQTKYDSPVHPELIDKQLKFLPYNVLQKIYISGESPVKLAIQSCTHRNKGWFSEGPHGVIHSGIQNPEYGIPYQPTKKEAYNWLLYNSNKGKQYDNSDARNSMTLLNWPSYMIKLACEKTGVDYLDLTDSQLLSFADMLALRWFCFNIKSTFWNKERTVHGPAGESRLFKPLAHVVHITGADLPNGLKTSPEKAFEQLNERKRKEQDEKYAKDEDIKFDTYPQYQPLPGVQVITNQKQLKIEGERMNHCVGGYGNSCTMGSSLILALPNSTAELDPKTLRVYQHFGMTNSDPDDSDVELLKQWIALNKK